MYNGQPALPVTGMGVMSIGGIAIGVMNIVWFGIAIVVLGGALITLSKFGPRFAFEPKQYGVNGQRWAFTRNGRVVRWFGGGK
jgi:hypothetical protein